MGDSPWYLRPPAWMPARHEGVPERVHLHERRRARGVAEVVGVAALREGGARGRLDGEDARVPAVLQVLPDKRERDPGEVRPAADAADDHVGVLAGELHLPQRLLPDHGLVQHDVVEHAAQRVLRVVVRGGVLDGLRDGDAERAGRVGVFLQDVAAGLGEVRRAGVDLRAVGLHHHAPVGLLVVADAHHVDGALEAHEPAREREGGAPLACPGLGRQAPDALLAVVVRLRDGGVRLVAAGGRDALVLVVDVGRGVEELLEAPGAEQGRRAPEAVDLAHLVRDGDDGLSRDLLLDDLLRERAARKPRARLAPASPGGAAARARTAGRGRGCTSSPAATFSSSTNFVVSMCEPPDSQVFGQLSLQARAAPGSRTARFATWSRLSWQQARSRRRRASRPWCPRAG